LITAPDVGTEKRLKPGKNRVVSDAVAAPDRAGISTTHDGSCGQRRRLLEDVSSVHVGPSPPV
jgi:hypothetical protein